MDAFMQWTAWPMEMPERYGLFHIAASVALLALTVWGAWSLRHTNSRQNRIVLGTVGAFLILTEIYKILFHIYVDPYGWQFWGTFPFQLCSVPMYLSLICAVLPDRKWKQWLYEYMFAVNMFGGIMAFLEPSGIQHTYITLTAHAYIWHMLLIFIGLYLYFSKRACVAPGGYKKAAIVYVVSCAVAQGFNLLFPGKINCFYISPYRKSPLAVFKDIYAACGWLVNMVLLIAGVLIASAAVYYIGHICRKKHK